MNRPFYFNDDCVLVKGLIKAFLTDSTASAGAWSVVSIAKLLPINKTLNFLGKFFISHLVIIVHARNKDKQNFSQKQLELLHI